MGSFNPKILGTQFGFLVICFGLARYQASKTKLCSPLLCGAGAPDPSKQFCVCKCKSQNLNEWLAAKNSDASLHGMDFLRQGKLQVGLAVQVKPSATPSPAPRELLSRPCIVRRYRPIRYKNSNNMLTFNTPSPLKLNMSLTCNLPHGEHNVFLGAEYWY